MQRAGDSLSMSVKFVDALTQQLQHDHGIYYYFNILER